MSDYGFVRHQPGQPEAINADSLDEDVFEAPGAVLVEFWAARCSPCRRLVPELAALARRYDGRLRVFTLAVDEEPEAAERCGVWTIPALLLFVGGSERARRLGVASAEELEVWLSEEGVR
jgi:thioredoxin 1